MIRYGEDETKCLWSNGCSETDIIVLTYNTGCIAFIQQTFEIVGVVAKEELVVLGSIVMVGIGVIALEAGGRLINSPIHYLSMCTEDEGYSL